MAQGNRKLAAAIERDRAIRLPVIRRASAVALRRNLGELLDEVSHGKVRILITKAGKPVAALIDITAFERLRKLDDEFQQLSGSLADAFAGLGQTRGTKLVERAIKAVRRAM
jgi:prevent-host-death family protein